MKTLKLVLLIIFFACGGCKKYLSEEPTVRASLKTVDQMDQLLENAQFNAVDGGNSNGHASASYSTDDTEIPMDAFKANPTVWTISNLYHYTFKKDEVIAEASDPLWPGEYKKIFLANLILENLGKVSGDENLKAQVKADAYFMRAYSHWILANHYCLPYSAANKDALGLPLKKTTNYDESLKRANLKETYDLIAADLVEAKKTTIDDVNPAKPWRVSKKAVEAFLSRYHLILGNYEESLIHTNNALASTKAVLVDWHSVVAGTRQNYSNPTASIINSEFFDWDVSKYLYWKEFYFARVSRNTSAWFIPSTNLLSLYDQSNDLRFKWLMLANSNRRVGITSHQLYRYSFFTDGQYIPTGPTVAEMLLNKAEILARKGEVSGAMHAVNILRLTRMTSPAPLSATDKADALVKVLQERRREMPFWMRWIDIRRFSVNEDPSDDVTVTRTFFKVNAGAVDISATETYILAPGSKRYAVPINGIERTASQNEMEQNQY